MRSAIYSGRVHHARLTPKKHRLSHRVFMLLLDLDELETLDRTLGGFGVNRRARAAFYTHDHADGDSVDLRAHIEGKLAREGIALNGGRIALLCMPRLLGYVFNPLSVYFCWDEAGMLKAIVYEVKNTFGERFDYVLPAREDNGVVRQSCEKDFFVSPFLPMNMRYEFTVTPPGEKIAVAMRVLRGDNTVLTASFGGDKSALNEANLKRAIRRHPAMTFGAIFAIHWHAIRLILKGAPFLGRKKAGAPPKLKFKRETATA